MIMRKMVVLALAMAATASCRPADQRTEELDPTGGSQAREKMPAEAVAHLDSGNVAMRDDDYETAVDHYTKVTELAPDFGSGWFGLYMAHRELGNEAEAEAALERARSIVPGATMLHQDPGGGVP